MALRIISVRLHWARQYPLSLPIPGIPVVNLISTSLSGRTKYDTSEVLAMLDNMDSDFDDSVDDPDYTSNESDQESKSEDDTVVTRKAKQQHCHGTELVEKHSPPSDVMQPVNKEEISVVCEGQPIPYEADIPVVIVHLVGREGHPIPQQLDLPVVVVDLVGGEDAPVPQQAAVPIIDVVHLVGGEDAPVPQQAAVPIIDVVHLVGGEDAPVPQQAAVPIIDVVHLVGGEDAPVPQQAAVPIIDVVHLVGGEDAPVPQQAAIPVVVVTERGARKRKSDPDSWRKNIRKNYRARGQEYVDTKGRQRAARAPQPSNCQTCRFKCNDNFSDEERSVICAEYWQLQNDSRQKDFLLSRVKIYGIQRERPRTERKRHVKSRTVVYSFIKNEKDERVCKKFFLKTLDIGHGPLDSAIESQGDAGTFVGEDKRGKHTPVNEISDKHIARVKQHIESFPKIESHYTRSDTRRLYLNQRLSISKMYRLYKEECERADPPVTPVKESQYRKTFCNDYNLSFFHPKKDQCSKCTKFRMLTGVEKEQFQEEYDAHITRKGEAQEAKSADKRRAIADKNFVSATFDLQCPPASCQ